MNCKECGQSFDNMKHDDWLCIVILDDRIRNGGITQYRESENK